MFKLPLLQPHLTGPNNNVDARTQGNHATPTKNGGLGSFLNWPLKDASTGLDFYGGSAEVKDWEAQGKDITSEVTCSERYKSLALHAEVKLAEALERCIRLCPDVYTTEGEEKPNKLKTAVCSQLLGEFAELCGPFGPALKTIRDELVHSIYSPLYASDRGLLVFDQIPWFKVAERLEQEKAMMLEERKRFQEILDEQQAMISRIEDQVGVYQHATQTTQQELLSLRGKAEALARSEESARLEARTGREELKKARKEWLKMKDDLDGERAAHKHSNAQAEQDISALQQHMKVLSDLVQRAEKTAHDAQRSLIGWVPPDEVAALQAQIKQLRIDQSSSKAKLQKAEEKLKAQAEAMGTMTPRPSWRALHAYGIQESEGKATQALVLAAAQKLSSQSENLHSVWEHVKLAQAVSLPDPLPRDIQLAITTDTSAYFLTEEPKDTPSTVHVEALGLGPNVPRCLRWAGGELLEVAVMSQQDTEILVMHILEAKRVYDAHHVPEHLQTFLYTYLSTQHPGLKNSCTSSDSTPSSRETGPTAYSPAFQRSSTMRPPSSSSSLMDSSQGVRHGRHQSTSGSGSALMQQPKGLRKSPSLMMRGALSREAKEPPPPTGQAEHAEVVRIAYSLYHALRIHAGNSPILRLFGRVLAGALPEEALGQQRLLLSAVAHAARRIAYAHATAAARQRAAATAAAAAAAAAAQSHTEDVRASEDVRAADARAGDAGRQDQGSSAQQGGKQRGVGAKGRGKKTSSRSQERGPSQTGESVQGEGGKQEEGDGEKKEEKGVPQVVLDPKDLVVPTEEMLGALEALLPGRPNSELAVLQDAYTSCVASVLDQQQQLRESDETAEEGSVAKGVPLQQLEELLQPMVLGCSTKTIAAHTANQAAGLTERQVNRDKEGTTARARFLASQRLGATLSNGFVSLLLTELVDELDEVGSQLSAAVAQQLLPATAAGAPPTPSPTPPPPATPPSQPPPGDLGSVPERSATPQQSASGAPSAHATAQLAPPPRSSSPERPVSSQASSRQGGGSATPPPHTSRNDAASLAHEWQLPLPAGAAQLLGVRAPAHLLVNALAAMGIAHADAVRVVGGALGCGGSGGAATLGSALVAAWRHGMLEGVPVWSGMAMAWARATQLLQRPGVHDVQGMLVWVEQLCASLSNGSGNDGHQGQEGEEGDGRKDGEQEDQPPLHQQQNPQ